MKTTAIITGCMIVTTAIAWHATGSVTVTDLAGQMIPMPIHGRVAIAAILGPFMGLVLVLVGAIFGAAAEALVKRD